MDELAGAFPEVPIVLTKMGRSIRASFDACRVVAMRKAKSNKRRGPSVTPYRRDEGGRSSRAISPSADPTTEWAVSETDYFLGRAAFEIRKNRGSEPRG